MRPEDAGSRVKYWISCTTSAFMIRKVKDKNPRESQGFRKFRLELKCRVSNEHNSRFGLPLNGEFDKGLAMLYFPSLSEKLEQSASGPKIWNPVKAREVFPKSNRNFGNCK
ncbi:hypothetical protein CEXT_615011 [Caerostris extrusa]|uniref:Uncharacterized protein n=1 Tax=Caerostris extrusa TaxID=172846 RepID=A0AAV4RW39_CAEEX|nr:hypothetical protein CEXT_615011 [Caerostris extrusa]